MTEDRGEMFDDEKKAAAEGGAPTPLCIEIRQEILATFPEGGVISETVSIHLVKCAPCREWESEVKMMHECCRDSQGAGDSSGLTVSILSACDIDTARQAGRPAAPGRGAARALDQGAFFVALLSVGLFLAIASSLLEGNARVLYPAVCAVAMILPAIWVYRDASKRGMPAGFWTALQPFTVPIGLAAYLVCRQRAAVRCPVCGAARSSRSTFCSECGGRLQETCCGCGKPVRREFRVCPFCGTRLEQCFIRDDEAGASCGWSRLQIAFLAAGNVALLGVLLAVLLRGEARSSFIAASLCLFGFFPIFNWVSIDARRRAMSSIAWGLLALVASYLGLVIYLACRKDERIACPVCGSHPPASFNYCPCCGSLLRSSCARCAAAAVPGDRFCASCGSDLS